MGIYHAMQKLKTVLDLRTYGFPLVTTLGVLPEARTGAHPMMYIDYPKVDLDSAALQGTYNTSSGAVVHVYLVMHELDPKFKELAITLDEFYLKTLPDYITNLILTANRDRTFAQDGAQGSLVLVRNIEYDRSPRDPITAMRITLDVSQFT